MELLHLRKNQSLAADKETDAKFVGDHEHFYVLLNYVEYVLELCL